MAVIGIVEYETIPTGEYPVQVADIEEEQGQFGPQLKLKLEIVGNGEHAGKTLTAWCGLTGSLKGKLAKWSAALGLVLEPGTDFDTDDLQGRRATAVVVVKTKDDGSEFSKVEELKAPKRKPAPAAAPKPAPAAADGEDPWADE